MRALQSVALLSFALFGCQDGSLGTGHPPLERTDVEDLGLGDAVGTTFSGEYLIVDFDVTHCECREGADTLDCSSVVPSATGLDVEQTDGALTITITGGSDSLAQDPYNGGINKDGTFVAGAALEVTDQAEDPIGVAFDLLEGRFDGQGGVEIAMRTRPQFSIDGSDVDCDLEYEIAAELN